LFFKQKEKMWLLHTSEFLLTQFSDSVAPPYAILSHTWGPEETTFDDIEEYRRTGKQPELARFLKIEGCCAKARSDGYDIVGLTPAASISVVARNFPKPLTACSGGMRMQGSATLTWRTIF